MGLVIKLTGWGGVGWVFHEIHRGWGGSYRGGVRHAEVEWGESYRGGVGHAVKQPKKMLVLIINI